MGIGCRRGLFGNQKPGQENPLSFAAYRRGKSILHVFDYSISPGKWPELNHRFYCGGPESTGHREASAAFQSRSFYKTRTAVSCRFVNEFTTFFLLLVSLPLSLRFSSSNGKTLPPGSVRRGCLVRSPSSLARDKLATAT